MSDSNVDYLVDHHSMVGVDDNSGEWAVYDAERFGDYICNVTSAELVEVQRRGVEVYTRSGGEWSA
ncbi:hypothetical protein [Saccharopolyspora sp. 6V]|uniref:hypothetical protein n=1 Tax=Saccharopolyspora sp. 6V TaxID=2877239 RepID=UPI001CD46373|nr:hypothetical protein [Saccharopolyspora sp. 6V]MCA1191640.1 hypothetical protein [Saccharopolyspora sp. 6V]